MQVTYISSSFFVHVYIFHLSSGCHGALNQKSHLCAILCFLADLPFKESEVEPGGVYIN